ncbi:MAG: hypothetical protein AAGB22_14740 [Bacteroidota bacterium]
MKLHRLFLWCAVAGAMSLGSCSSDDSDDDSTPTPGPTEPTGFFFQAEINGQLVQFEDGVGLYGSGAGASSTNAGQEEQSLNLQQPFSGTNLAWVSFIQTFSQPVTECAQIESMFAVKAYGYGNSNTGVDGIVVNYIDANGTHWASDKGTAMQAASSFAVTNHDPNTDGFSERISRAEFACTLYDDNGNSVPLLNGKIRSRSTQCGHL